MATRCWQFFWVTTKHFRKVDAQVCIYCVDINLACIPICVLYIVGKFLTDVILAIYFRITVHAKCWHKCNCRNKSVLPMKRKPLVHVIFCKVSKGFLWHMENFKALDFFFFGTFMIFIQTFWMLYGPFIWGATLQHDKASSFGILLPSSVWKFMWIT